jgi:uncharacterized membrane protein
MMMKKGLWTAQIIGGLFFIAIGVTHFSVPEGLPGTFSWMHEISDTTHAIVGTAEILGGVGLILPAITRIRPRLVPLAAVGLAVVMLAAVVFHIARGEWVNVGANVFWVALMGFVAYGRSKIHPIQPKSAVST